MEPLISFIVIII